jgi:uncharacterized OsmC-like protein
MTSTVVYSGELRTVANHLASGTTIETDAPTDNQGKGERFSPTDLVATALASCMGTIMGIAARTHNINIDGTRFEVTKVMAQNPRRIGEIVVDIHFPPACQYSDKERTLLERAALTCPVFESLHPDCQKTVQFLWPGSDQS